MPRLLKEPNGVTRPDSAAVEEPVRPEVGLPIEFILYIPEHRQEQSHMILRLIKLIGRSIYDGPRY